MIPFFLPIINIYIYIRSNTLYSYFHKILYISNPNRNTRGPKRWSRLTSPCVRLTRPPWSVPPEVESSEIWEAWALWSVLGRCFDDSDDSNDAFVLFLGPAGLSPKGLEQKFVPFIQDGWVIFVVREGKGGWVILDQGRFKRNCFP